METGKIIIYSFCIFIYIIYTINRNIYILYYIILYYIILFMHNKIIIIITMVIVLMFVMISFSENIDNNSNIINNDALNNNFYVYDNTYNMDNSSLNFSWCVYINNNLQSVNLVYYNNVNNYNTFIYKNNNFTMFENNIFLKYGGIKSYVYIISNINANYYVIFNVESYNYNHENYSYCEIINNKIKNVNIGPYVFYNTNLNPVITSIDGFNDLKIPYEFHLNKGYMYVIDPIICPGNPCNPGGGSSGSGSCHVTTKECTWSLSGYTDLYSKYNLNGTMSLNGSDVEMEFHVTSFSSSSGSAANARICLYGHTPYNFQVSGTGVFKFSLSCDANGKIPVDVSYTSYRKVTTYIHCNPDYARTDVSTSTSYTGGSYYYNHHLYNYIGYDGNNTIYLSNICHQPTYGIYGQTTILCSKSEYMGNGIANNSIDIGESSFTEYDSGSNLYVIFNLTNTGAGHQELFCSREGSYYYEPYKLIIKMQTDNADYACINMYNSKYGGYNITNINSKNIAEIDDIASLINDAFSLIPYYGYAVTAEQAAGTAENLIHNVNNPYKISGTSTDDEPSEISFIITGGNLPHGSEGQNLYSAGDYATLKIPNSDLNNNFTVDITYGTEYKCPINSGIKASTTQVINAVTSSAIYGTVGLKPGCSDNNNDYNTSLNSTIYIEDVNNGNFYKVPIKNGHYLFFAEPNTKYELFYYDKSTGEFKNFKNNSGTIISYIESGNPGESILTGLYE